MLDNLTIAEFACRASNLSERLAISKKLAFSNALESCTAQLSPLDTWTLNKLAGKLAATQVKQQLYQQLATNIPTQLNLQKLLTDYKLYELNLSNLSESERSEFIQPHATWLKVYTEALMSLDLSPDNFAGSGCYQPNIYYGRFAKVCEPFLRWLQQKLQPICKFFEQTIANYKISLEVITDIQLELVNRFEWALAHVIEADINLYCYQNGINKSSDSQAYIDYLDATFNNEQGYHKFYAKFPVLARHLAQVSDFLSKIGAELLQRLSSERRDISTTFFDDIPIEKITGFSLGNSDAHAGGHTVVMVDLELANSQSKTIVYKPRCIQSEAAMQGLLATLTREKVVQFGNYRLLCKQGYGYVEFLPVQNHAENLKIVEIFYQQLGGYLAIFHILGGSDLHFENILVSNCNAFICDCETALEVVPRRLNKSPDTMFDSVFSTGMLDWPLPTKKPDVGDGLRPAGSDRAERISLSGYTGGESYTLPFAVPQINNRLSLALTVEHQVGVEVKVEGTNRIYYQGQLVHPYHYQQCILDGFNKVYDWVRKNHTQAIGLLEKLFAGSSVRFVNRATQVYAHLLNSARHPKCLAEPLEVDLVYHTLIEHPRLWDDTGQLAELELTALWQLDIPIFTAKADAKELIFNYQQQLPESLVISPLDNAIARIQRLSVESQMRQNQYIYTSLSTGEINNQHFIDSAVNYAYEIGRELCSLLQDSSESAPWKTIDFTATAKCLVDINSSIYTGSAGIALFLAYLDVIRPHPEFRQAANRALIHGMEECDGLRPAGSDGLRPAGSDRVMIGAFQGKAGLIYLLTHLGQLWKQPELWQLASDLCDELYPLISQDDYYDIINGVSGVIPVMLGLAEVTMGKGMNCAIACAEHLLQNAVPIGDTLAWPYNPELARDYLTGFAHGVAGIGWALIRLGVYTNQPKYITTGLQAFAYEATQFDHLEGNWYDLRTSVMTKQAPGAKFGYFWCSGAAGIGLSRIDSWAALGKTDANILREAQKALDITLRHFNRLTDDSLCHGRSGNSELLLRCALLQDEPYLQMEANVQATAQWRNFERAHRWTCGAGGSDVLPDLMTGLAGIGMHFLRLAYPQLIPSPLLLDTPPKQVAS
ncbi:type 2 lantibiotic biosynthesis protein LanM [Cylindrospermum stagnale PCC 7417]|uniref:Type 2 lantibiotic biosynthesis protein LanM n=1 Tax=Cylindrospermum stagnale PCC 7417 TaxID=56107 RepID=K9WU68_9NOST|nr:type 2 lanthipeptide synthetase LanM family protein [Cylindrospermum stagnale]AFZ23930.1 type 2 lantibiotic biosynthesis protein LanM [Cylindrospermum stagnale PCC 7417]